MLELETKTAAHVQSGAANQPKSAEQLAPIIPDDIRFLFEPRPLTIHEDPGDYDRLLALIVQDVKPRDMIEWIWVKDIVDLAWEARRLRLYKVLVTRVRMRKAGGRLLAQVFEPETSDGVQVFRSERAVSDYQSGNGKGITPVLDALDALGLPEDALSVAAFIDALPELEKIEQMLRSVESRRNLVLREIERQRFATSQRLRSASEAVVVDLIEAGPETNE
jgi:hypothetical protein